MSIIQLRGMIVRCCVSALTVSVNVTVSTVPFVCTNSSELPPEATTNWVIVTTTLGTGVGIAVGATVFVGGKGIVVAVAVAVFVGGTDIAVAVVERGVSVAVGILLTPERAVLVGCDEAVTMSVAVAGFGVRVSFVGRVVAVGCISGAGLPLTSCVLAVMVPFIGAVAK